MQSLMFTGYLGKDCELMKSPSGKDVVRVSIATEGKYNAQTRKNDVVWLYTHFWDNQASYMAKYGKKGNTVCVHGKLYSYKGKDGKDTIYVNATEVKLINDQKVTYKEREEITGDLNDIRQDEINYSQPAQAQYEISQDDLPF